MALRPPHRRVGRDAGGRGRPGAEAQEHEDGRGQGRLRQGQEGRDTTQEKVVCIRVVWTGRWGNLCQLNCQSQDTMLYVGAYVYDLPGTGCRVWVKIFCKLTTDPQTLAAE